MIEALRREVWEEVGLKKFDILYKFKHVEKYDWPFDIQIRNGFRGQRQRLFLCRFNPVEKIRLNKELKYSKWVKKEDLLDYLKYRGFPKLVKILFKELNEKFDEFDFSTSKQIRCVIFDIGDTLYNSELIRRLNKKQQPELEVLRQAGFKFSEKKYLATWGKIRKDWGKLKYKNRTSFISYYVQRYLGIRKPSWKLARKMHAAFIKLHPNFSPEQMLAPNARNIISWLAKRRYYLGVVSDANTKGGKKWLGKVKLDKHFHHISISCEIGYEKSTSKPFELFLKKMQKKHKIKLEPEECLVVDDSQGACANAQSIGMKAALYDPFRRKHLRVYPDYHIYNLMQIKQILEHK